MKRLLLVTVLVFMLASCSKRYTQSSKEIETLQKAINLYSNQQFDEIAVFYADSAKIINNVPEEEAITIAQRITQNKEQSALFSTWKINSKIAEYEMVVTDKGETWVNYWGQWEGTLKLNNKLYVIPTCITAKFVDGKIVREVGFWDESKLVIDLQNLKAVSDIDTPDQFKIVKK